MGDAGGAGNNRPPTPELQGIIAVFDLDHTIIGSIKGEYIDNAGVKSILNPRIIDILQRLALDRERNPWTHIFLLTNNSSLELIQLVDAVLLELTGFRPGRASSKVHQFFDAIMTRDHVMRSLVGSKKPREIILSGAKHGRDNTLLTPTKARVSDPPKTLGNVRQLLLELYVEGDTLDKLWNPSHIFFFDDRNDHKLVGELKAAGFPRNYVEIKPPFESEIPDKTDLTNVDAYLLTKPQELGSRARSATTGSLSEAYQSGAESESSSKGNINTNRPPNPLANTVSENNDEEPPEFKGGAWKHRTWRKKQKTLKSKSKKKTAKKNLRSKYRK
jgi:hypothetical protein